MTLYDDLALTAGALLAQFGQSATLNKRAQGAYDAATRTVTQAPTQYQITVVVGEQIEKRTPETATVQELRELLIRADNLEVTIDSNDTITVGAKTYKVIDPGPVSPAGVVVVYNATVGA